MEKTIKLLSIAISVAVISFVFITVIAANADSIGVPDFMYQFLLAGAQAFMFLIPISYVFLAGFGMSNLMKRLLSKRNKFAGTSMVEKFPTVPFVISSVLFLVFVFFLSAIIAA